MYSFRPHQGINKFNCIWKDNYYEKRKASFRPHQGINKFNLIIENEYEEPQEVLSFRPHQGINKFNMNLTKMVMNTYASYMFPSPSGDQ